MKLCHCLQEIDELLGQNLTAEDEDAIAEELESIISVSWELQILQQQSLSVLVGAGTAAQCSQ